MAGSSASERMPLMANGSEKVSMRRADVVLVFPNKTSDKVQGLGTQGLEEGSRGLEPPKESEKQIMETWAVKRQSEMSKLASCGLRLLPYYSRDRENIFVKVIVDEQHLRDVAEMIGYKLELKKEYLSAYAPYKNDFMGQRELNYKDRCIVSHIYQTHSDGTEYPRPDAIFRTVDRIRILDHILTSQDRECAGVALGQLMHDGDLLHYFPLHEHKELSELDKEWFWGYAWPSERIEKIRAYFGERVAFYFLFQGYFNKCMVIPALVGPVLWLYDIFSGTPDNFFAVPLCVATGVWTTCFIPFWRRREAEAAQRWGTSGIKRSQEANRPQFYGQSRINPVTERIDLYYPFREQVWKILWSYTVIACALVALLFMILFLMLLRHLTAQAGGRFLFQCMNAIVVEILNDIFSTVAKLLTDMENHRTESEYTRHLLAKSVVFKFCNSYFSLYYIAFFKYHSHLFGIFEMNCMSGDCLEDLATQLAIFLVVRITLQNFIEIGVPFLMMRIRNHREGRQMNMSVFSNNDKPNMSSAEKQCGKESYSNYEQMDEFLIFYGYATLFVTVCPWAPLLVLVSNLLECFLDQKKLVHLSRRPKPELVGNNQPWDTVFDIVGWIAMATNLAVVIFSSHQFDEWTHSEKILLFLFFEHVIVFLRVMVNLIFPAIPKNLRILALKQAAMARKHLDQGGEDEDSEMRVHVISSASSAQIRIHERDQDDYEDC